MRLCTYSVPPGTPRLGAECAGVALDLARYSHVHDGLRLPADMQGLIDAHGHVIDLGTAATTVQLTGASSLSELQQRLGAYAPANPDKAWIRGFVHGRVREQRL